MRDKSLSCLGSVLVSSSDESDILVCVGQQPRGRGGVFGGGRGGGGFGGRGRRQTRTGGWSRTRGRRGRPQHDHRRGGLGVVAVSSVMMMMHEKIASGVTVRSTCSLVEQKNGSTKTTYVVYTVHLGPSIYLNVCGLRVLKRLFLP